MLVFACCIHATSWQSPYKWNFSAFLRSFFYASLPKWCLNPLQSKPHSYLKGLPKFTHKKLKLKLKKPTKIATSTLGTWKIRKASDPLGKHKGIYRQPTYNPTPTYHPLKFGKIEEMSKVRETQGHQDKYEFIHGNLVLTL